MYKATINYLPNQRTWFKREANDYKNDERQSINQYEMNYPTKFVFVHINLLHDFFMIIDNEQVNSTYYIHMAFEAQF
jgi:hypothetical protein